MAITAGQAVALGNLATPSYGTPFTNAVLNRQRLDLANQAQEAKRRAEIEKNAQEIAKTMNFKKGGVLNVYQDDIRDISSMGYAQGMAEKDAVKRSAIIDKTQFELDNIKYANDQLVSNLNSARANGIAPKEIIDIFYSPKKEANEKFANLMKVHPEYSALVGKNQDGTWYFNYVQAMPMNDILGQAANRLKQTAITDTTKTRDIGGGVNEFTSTAEPSALAAEAQAIASSKDWGLNVMLNDPKTYSKFFDKAVANAKQVAAQTGVEPTKEEIQHAAVLEYTANALKDRATYTERKGQPTPAKGQLDLSLDFGGGGAQTSGVGGAGNTIPVEVNFEPSGKPAFKKKGNVVTGSPHSFHTVSVINTNSQNSINAKTNQPLGNQVFEELKVGDAVAVPIAVIDIKDPKTGRTYKAGQMVDEAAIKGLKSEGMVEYVPMFKGIGTVTKGNKKETISTLTPVGQTADAVILGQTTGDAPLTKDNIQASINDARKMNEELNKRFKPKATSTGKSGKSTGKKYVGLDENGNPKFE